MNLYALIDEIGGKRERGKRKALKFCSHFTLINKEKQKMKKKIYIYTYVWRPIQASRANFRLNNQVKLFFFTFPQPLKIAIKFTFTSSYHLSFVFQLSRKSQLPWSFQERHCKTEKSLQQVPSS